MKTDKIISNEAINRVLYILVLGGIASFFGACARIEDTNNCGGSFFAPAWHLEKR